MTDMNIDLSGQRRRRDLEFAHRADRASREKLAVHRSTTHSPCLFKCRRIADACLLIESVEALTLQLSLSICLVYFLWDTPSR